MNLFKYSLFFIGACTASFLAYADSTEREGGHAIMVAQSISAPARVPADNTLRRINPNTRQGSSSSVPPVRGPSTLPTQPLPSLERGQISNGYPRQTTPPKTIRPTAPSLQPRDSR